MRKKLLIVCILGLIVCAFCSCGNKSHDKQTDFPFIKVCNSFWTFEDTIIDEGMNKCELIKSHPYDVVKTENGVDIVIHFEGGDDK